MARCVFNSHFIQYGTNVFRRFKFFKRYLKNWEIEDDWDNCYIFGKYAPVGQFIIDEDEQVPAMVQFLRECTDELEALKKIDPKIFK